MDSNLSKFVEYFGYVIPVYFEGAIIKSLLRKELTFILLEKDTIRVKLELLPSAEIKIDDCVLVATDKTCNLHIVANIKNNTIQTRNRPGKSTGFVPDKYIYGKVINIQFLT